MKNNIIKYIALLVAAPVLFTACKKNAPDQWLKDNITIIGKVPVIASFTVKPPSTTDVVSGNSIQLDLRYWSDEDIDKVNLKSTVGATAQQLVSATPYQKAYSQISRTDSLLLSYPVPAGLTKGTVISMVVEVVGKNSLVKATKLDLKVL